MMKHADKWWRDQVMSLFPNHSDGSLRWPCSKDDICEAVSKANGFERGFPSWPYIDRAVRQLKVEGTLIYFSDWQGWATPDFEGLKAARDRASQKKHDDFMREHDRKMAEHAREHRENVIDRNKWRRQMGMPEVELPPPYVSKYGVDHDKIEKLKAMATSTTFPHEAEAFRAKIAELERRQR